MEENKVLCLFYGSPESAESSTVELVGKNFDKVKFFVTESEEIANEFALDSGSFILLK